MINKTMKVIRPTDITDAMLVSSTAPETDYAAYATGTTYALGARVILASTHRVYESLLAGNVGHAPDAALSTYWLDIGPTNRWAMFDNVVGTQTTLASPLTTVLRPGSVSGLALMELAGTSAEITMKDATGGTTVYSRSINLDGTPVNSIFDWFYQPFVQLTDTIVTDMPYQYPSCELTLRITGAGSVRCGVAKVGEVIEIGATLAGATSGIVDYSVKTKDAFGRYTFVERAYSKRMSLKLITEKSDYSRISRALAALRVKPCIWIATSEDGYDPLTIYGKYNDFSIDVAYPTLHYCTLEIEGLI